VRTILFLATALAAGIALPALAQIPAAPVAPAGFPPGSSILPTVPSPPAATMPGMTPGMMTGASAATSSTMDTSAPAAGGYQSPAYGSSPGSAAAMAAYGGSPSPAYGSSLAGAGSMAAYGYQSPANAPPLGAAAGSAAYGGSPSMTYPH
jgi:hypothetical protein